MNRLKFVALGLLSATLAAAAIAPVRADDFPDRPLHLIIPYGPGGIVDFTGRVLAQKLSDVLKQTVVPDNRPGAGGIVGTDFVAHSDPDGYNLVIIDPAIVINPTLQKSLPLRHLQGSGDGIARQFVARGAGGSAAAWRENLCRACRLRQSQSGQAQLRLGRSWHRAASCRRVVGAGDRRQGRACALQRYRRLVHRYDEQQSSDGVFQYSGGVAVHQRQPRAAAGDHHAQNARRSIPICRPSPSPACPATMSTCG